MSYRRPYDVGNRRLDLVRRLEDVFWSSRFYVVTTSIHDVFTTSAGRRYDVVATYNFLKGYGQTDGQTIYNRNTALCTKVHRAVKA